MDIILYNTSTYVAYHVIMCVFVYVCMCVCYPIDFINAFITATVPVETNFFYRSMVYVVLYCGIKNFTRKEFLWSLSSLWVIVL